MNNNKKPINEITLTFDKNGKVVFISSKTTKKGFVEQMKLLKEFIENNE